MSWTIPVTVERTNEFDAVRKTVRRRSKLTTLTFNERTRQMSRRKYLLSGLIIGIMAALTAGYLFR